MILLLGQRVPCHSLGFGLDRCAVVVRTNKNRDLVASTRYKLTAVSNDVDEIHSSNKETAPKA